MPSAPTCPADAALALAELRRQRGLSQVEVAGQMAVSQAQVARCESRGDMYLTSLRRYIEALGGELELVAHFPEHSHRLRLGGENTKNTHSMQFSNRQGGHHAEIPHPIQPADATRGADRQPAL